MIILLALSLALTAQSTTINLHVASDTGSDLTGVGTPHQPFATIAAAATAARQHPHAKVDILIQPGTYPSFALEPEDSGTSPETQRTYIGASSNLMGKTATIDGGIEIPASLFHLNIELTKQTRNSNLKVFTADLTSLNIKPSSLGTIVAGGCVHGCTDMPSGLSFGTSSSMRLARWPNVQQVSKLETNSYVHGGLPCGAGCQTLSADNAKTSNINKWSDEKNAWIHGYFEWDWADCYRKINQVTTTTTTTSSFNITFTPATETPKNNSRFYILNALSELDDAGEFYMEGNGTTLHLIPPSDIIGPPNTWTSGPTLSLKEAVVNISNTKNVVLKNLNIVNGRGVGIDAEHVENVTITACNVSHHGQQGIFSTNATRITIENNDVREVGCAGIHAHGGSALTLERGKLIILSFFTTLCLLLTCSLFLLHCFFFFFV